MLKHPHSPTKLFAGFTLTKRIRSMALLLVILCCTSSCFQKIYKKTAVTHVDRADIAEYINRNKKFILHGSNGAWLLGSPILGKDSLSGSLVPLTTKDIPYNDPLNPDERLNGKKALVASDHVHLYFADSLRDGKAIAIPLDSFRRMETFHFDKGASNGSTIASILGIAAGVTLSILIVAAASTSGGFGTHR